MSIKRNVIPRLAINSQKSNTFGSMWDEFLPSFPRKLSVPSVSSSFPGSQVHSRSSCFTNRSTKSPDTTPRDRCTYVGTCISASFPGISFSLIQCSKNTVAWRPLMISWRRGTTERAPATRIFAPMGPEYIRLLCDRSRKYVSVTWNYVPSREM